MKNNAMIVTALYCVISSMASAALACDCDCHDDQTSHRKGQQPVICTSAPLIVKTPDAPAQVQVQIQPDPNVGTPPSGDAGVSK
jgi:hypothetical protein